MNDFKQAMAAEGIEEEAEGKERAHIKGGERQPTVAQIAARIHATQEESPNYLRDFLDEKNQVTPDHQFQWRQDGAQGAVLHQLIHGRYDSHDQLDLHHKTVREAHALLWEFLSRALEQGHRNVSVIHGRGEKSNPPARLKSYVGQVLEEHKDVFAFCSAPPELGGTGATLVWLRKSEADKEATRELIQSRRG